MPELPADPQTIRHDWQREEVLALYALPFNDLLYRAHGMFRTWHDPNKVQISTLLSIKTGACPEDCAYCPAKRPLQHRHRARTPAVPGGGRTECRRRQGKRSLAILHGGRLAQSHRQASG